MYRNTDEHDWSERVESARKDIECVFGKVKGRFRIFWTKILFNDKDKIDNAWFTACIIHNMLLQFDGLDVLEKDVDWEGADGDADDTTAEFLPEEKTDDVTEDVPEDVSFTKLRDELVEHFTYKKRRGELAWFRRAK